MPKKIVDARADSDGDITDVLFQGNSTFTPLQQLLEWLTEGRLRTHTFLTLAKANPICGLIQTGRNGTTSTIWLVTINQRRVSSRIET